MRFRALLGAVLATVLIWSGWWWLGSTGEKAALEGWLADRRAAGWVAETRALEVTGYPFRFDAFFSGLSLADPGSGWAWEAPEFQVLALAYKPNHIIAAWPGAQRIGRPGESVTVQGDSLRGSVLFVPDTDLALSAITLEFAGLRIDSDQGWSARAERGVLAARQAAAGTAPDHAQDIGLDASGLDLPEALIGGLNLSGLVAARIEKVELDATLSFDAPWDRHAVEGPKPVLTGLSLRKAEIAWGDLHFSARGRFTIGPDGAPEGEIDVTARGWRRMLKGAVAAGVLPADLAATLEAGLSVASLLSGDPDTLKVPLRLTAGQIALGPVPLGPAPRFPVPR